MKNKFLNYLSVYQEVISASEYRDTQLAKTKNGLSDIKNYKIENITFFKDFIEKIKNNLLTFPDEMDKKADVYSIKDLPDDEYSNRLQTVHSDYAPDDDEDEGHWDDDQLDEDEDEDEEDENYDESVKTPSRKAFEHLYKSVDGKSLTTINNFRKDIEEIEKNKDIENDLIRYIKNHCKPFVNLYDKRNYNDDFDKYLYCGILNYYLSNKYMDRLVKSRGDNYIWLTSHIKDAIFSPYFKQKSQQTSERIKLKNRLRVVVPDFETKTNSQISADITDMIGKTKNEKEKTKLNELLTKIQDNKLSMDMEELSVNDARKVVMQLFNNIKRNIRQNAVFNKSFTTLGSRKFVFDFNTGKPSALDNEISKNNIRLQALLVKLGYTFNEIEFEIGRVRDGKNLMSFKELVPILRQKQSEIKSFSPEKESEIEDLTQELDVAEDELIIFDTLKNIDKNQIADLKKLLGYGEEVNKNIGDLIQEANKIDKEKTKEILKKYNRNKLNKLLALIREKLIINTESNKKLREEYEEIIELLSDMQHIHSNQKMKIIFTLSPREFISQSTRANLTKSIKSCMNVFYGLNRKFLPTALMSGSFTVWLVKVNKDKDGNDIIDSKIVDPLARIVVKPFKNSNGDVFFIPDNVYAANDNSDFVSKFNSKVFEILNHNNVLPNDMYYLDTEANYRDSVVSITNDVFSRLMYNDEKMEKVKKEMSAGDAIYLNKKIQLNNKPEKIFEKMLKVSDKNLLQNVGLYDISDIVNVPKGNYNELEIWSRNVKKIDSDADIKELTIKSTCEKLNSLENIKNIDKIKNLYIYNGAKIPAKLLKSKTIGKLSFQNKIGSDEDIDIDGVLDLMDLKVNAKKISAGKIILNKVNTNKVKEIKAKKIFLNSLCEDNEDFRKYKKFKEIIGREIFSDLDIAKIFIIIRMISLNDFKNKNIEQLIRERIEMSDTKMKKFKNILLNFLNNDKDLISRICKTKLSREIDYRQVEYEEKQAALKKYFYSNFNENESFDFNKINADELEELGGYMVFDKIDLRRFKNLKILKLENFNNIKELLLPPSIVVVKRVKNFSVLKNINELKNLKSLLFTTSVQSDKSFYPENVDNEIFKNLIEFKFDIDEKTFDKRFILSPYIQLLYANESPNRGIRKIINVSSKKKSEFFDFYKKNKIADVKVLNYSTPFNKHDIKNAYYSNKIVFDFENETTKANLTDKTVYVDNSDSSKIIIENNFFDFYVDTVIPNNINPNVSLEVEIYINEKTPKKINLKKITEKLIISQYDRKSIRIKIFLKDSEEIKKYEIESDIGYSFYYQGTYLSPYLDKTKKIEISMDGYPPGFSLEITESMLKKGVINVDDYLKIKDSIEYTDKKVLINLDFKNYITNIRKKYDRFFRFIMTKENKIEILNNFINKKFKPIERLQDNLKLVMVDYTVEPISNIYYYKIIAKILENNIDLVRTFSENSIYSNSVIDNFNPYFKKMLKDD